MESFELNINGQKHQIEVDKDKPLLWVLRDELGLTGTKYGCGVGQCGACTVHLGETPIRSCSITISAIGNAKITTIEEVSKDKNHPVLKAWSKINVPQCGYCQTSQVMSTIALLKNKPKPSEKEIEMALNGNLCRCGTYFRIKKAIQSAIE